MLAGPNETDFIGTRNGRPLRRGIGPRNETEKKETTGLGVKPGAGPTDVTACLRRGVLSSPRRTSITRTRTYRGRGNVTIMTRKTGGRANGFRRFGPSTRTWSIVLPASSVRASRTSLGT